MKKKLILLMIFSFVLAMQPSLATIVETNGNSYSIAVPSYSSVLRDWYTPGSYNNGGGYAISDNAASGGNYYSKDYFIFSYILTHPDGAQEILRTYKWDSGTITGSENIYNPYYSPSSRTHYYSKIEIPGQNFEIDVSDRGHYKIELKETEIPAILTYKNPKAEFSLDDLLGNWTAENLEVSRESYDEYPKSPWGMVYTNTNKKNACVQSNDNGNISLKEIYYSQTMNTNTGQYTESGFGDCSSAGLKSALETACNYAYDLNQLSWKYSTYSKYCWLERNQFSQLKVSDLGSNAIWVSEFDIKDPLTITDIKACGDLNCETNPSFRPNEKIYFSIETSEPVQKSYVVVSKEGETNNDGSLLHWRLDESSGTTATDSGSGKYDGILTSESMRLQNLNAVKASGNVIDSNFPEEIAGNAPFTTEFWFNASSLSGNEWLMAFGSPNENNAYHIGFYWADPTRIRIGWWGHGFGTGYAVEKNKWYHLAVVYDGSIQKVYLNGVSNYQYGTMGANPNLGIGSLRIGRQFDPVTGEAFDGSLGGIKIYSRALSDSEIQSDYSETWEEINSGKRFYETTYPVKENTFEFTPAEEGNYNLDFFISTNDGRDDSYSVPISISNSDQGTPIIETGSAVNPFVQSAGSLDGKAGSGATGFAAGFSGFAFPALAAGAGLASLYALGRLNNSRYKNAKGKNNVLLQILKAKLGNFGNNFYSGKNIGKYSGRQIFGSGSQLENLQGIKMQKLMLENSKQQKGFFENLSRNIPFLNSGNPKGNFNPGKYSGILPGKIQEGISAGQVLSPYGSEQQSFNPFSSSKNNSFPPPFIPFKPGQADPRKEMFGQKQTGFFENISGTIMGKLGLGNGFAGNNLGWNENNFSLDGQNGNLFWPEQAAESFSNDWANDDWIRESAGKVIKDFESGKISPSEFSEKLQELSALAKQNGNKNLAGIISGFVYNFSDMENSEGEFDSEFDGNNSDFDSSFGNNFDSGENDFSDENNSGSKMSVSGAGLGGISLLSGRTKPGVSITDIKSGFTDYGNAQIQKTKDFFAFLEEEKNGYWVKKWEAEEEARARYARERELQREMEAQMQTKSFAQTIAQDSKSIALYNAVAGAREAIDELNSGKINAGWFKDRMEFLAKEARKGGDEKLAREIENANSQAKSGSKEIMKPAVKNYYSDENDSSSGDVKNNNSSGGLFGFIGSVGTEPAKTVRGVVEGIFLGGITAILEDVQEETHQKAREWGLDPLKREHNNEADAWRHAETSKRMTEKYGDLFALAAGAYHEIVDGKILSGQPQEEFNMDMHNNKLGREIAGTNTTSEDLLFGGKLIVNEPDLKSSTLVSKPDDYDYD